MSNNSNENDFLKERLELSAERIKGLKQEFADRLKDGSGEPYDKYFAALFTLADKITGLTVPVASGDYRLLAVDKKAEINAGLYEDIRMENYATSFANPDYASKMLGKKEGKLLSALYYRLYEHITAVFDGALFEVVSFLELLLEIYGIWEENEKNMAAQIKNAIYYYEHDNCYAFVANAQKRAKLPEKNVIAKRFENEDTDSEDFLFGYGECVLPHQLEVFSYIKKLSEEQIESMAETFVGGYVRGFAAAGIDFSERKIVDLRYPMGFERLIKKAYDKFLAMGKRCNALLLHENVNRQCEYDHRNDNVLWLDARYRRIHARAYESALKEMKDELAVYGGPAVLEAFGEPDFKPVNCVNALTPTAAQRKLTADMHSDNLEILCRYVDMEKRSFTIMSLPFPTITEGRNDLDYTEIFDGVMKLNTLDNELYKKLQQTIIDLLDKGEYVLVKGSGENKTDIKVMLHELKNPDKETNFENCVADVNIPVGEVFTSPILTGTNGVLNVAHAFLEGFEYKNLTLKFSDGMITEYSCDNFPTEAENREYIFEKILFNHDTLPIGEFAIGTNTTAYALADRLQIWDKLPILIAEKTGPHFAVGDTCYSQTEDFMTYNPDGKAIIARDNEVSILRKTDMKKAYMNCHTDITIPYDELDYIRAVEPDGTVHSIIENGRFVFEGAEELNRALDNEK